MLSSIKHHRVHSAFILAVVLGFSCTEDEPSDFGDRSDVDLLEEQDDAESPSDVTVVEDLIGGGTVEIRRVGSGSLITNLDTGESIEVEGDYTDVSDEEYTEMMTNKRAESAELELDEPFDLVETKQTRSGSSQFSFYTTGGGGGFTSPYVYVNSSSLKLYITQTVNQTTLTVTLYKKVDFWPDSSMGAKTCSYASCVGTWSVTSGKYYRVNITRSYQAPGTTGTVNFVW